MSNNDPYLRQGAHWILDNKLDLINSDDLEQAELAFGALRSVTLDEATKDKGYGMDRLSAIHGHLFQDLYDWAGETRTISLRKNSNEKTFSNPSSIDWVVGNVESYIENNNFFKDMSDKEFAHKMAHVYNKLNEAHPFREGNGRTARAFMQDLASESGRSLDWGKVSSREWNRASKEAFNGDQKALSQVFEQATLSYEMNTDYDPKKLVQYARTVERLSGGSDPSNASLGGKSPDNDDRQPSKARFEPERSITTPGF